MKNKCICTPCTKEAAKAMEKPCPICEEQKKCPHLNCLVYHPNGVCNCNMKRYCSICKQEDDRLEEMRFIKYPPLPKSLDSLEVGDSVWDVNGKEHVIDGIFIDFKNEPAFYSLGELKKEGFTLSPPPKKYTKDEVIEWIKSLLITLSK